MVVLDRQYSSNGGVQSTLGVLYRWNGQIIDVEMKVDDHVGNFIPFSAYLVFNAV